jgi:hypothetical protein
MMKALEQHGERADRALEHASFIQQMAEKFGTSAEQAGRGARPLADLPALTGFEKNVRAGLETTYIPERHFQFMEQVSNAMAPRDYGVIEQAARKSLEVWKPLVTLTRPEFWVRNWAWSKFIQGAYGNVDPANDARGLALVTGSAPREVYKDFPQIGPVTQEALRREFIRNRIIGPSRALDIGQAGSIGKALGPRYQRIEDGLRASYATHLLRKGATMEEAADGVRNLMFNYGPEAFTPGIQNLRQKWFPFAAWAINIPKLTGRTLGERPGAVGILGTLAGDVNRAVGLDPRDEANLGKTFAERGGFATAPADASGNVRGVTFSPMGLTDPNQWGPRPYHKGPLGPVQGQADAAISMTHPLANLIAQLSTGRNFLGGYQYGEGPVRLPAWSRVLAGKVPGVHIDSTTGQPYGPWRLAQTLQLVGPVPNVFYDIQDPREQAQRSAIKALTAIPFTRTNVYENEKWARRDARADTMAAREKRSGRPPKAEQRFLRKLEREAVTR